MSATEAKAASISPPQEGFARIGVVAGEVFMLPAKWHRSYITVQAEGQDVYVFLRVAKATAVPTVPDQSARSTITSNAIDLVANFCAHIPAGTERHFNLDELDEQIKSKDDRIWFGHDCLVVGVVRGFKSSGPKG